MRKRKLIIHWKKVTDSGFPIDAPHIESFFTKSYESAMRIIDRRKKENINVAFFQGEIIYSA